MKTLTSIASKVAILLIFAGCDTLETTSKEGVTTKSSTFNWAAAGALGKTAADTWASSRPPQAAAVRKREPEAKQVVPPKVWVTPEQRAANKAARKAAKAKAATQ